VVRGGDTSPCNEGSVRGDCWLRKRNSSIRSLVLFEYAIFDVIIDILSRSVSCSCRKRAGRGEFKVGFTCGVLSSGNTPSLERANERRTDFPTCTVSKKKNCDVRERPGRPGAKQESCISRKERICVLGRGR
jgi:hypothetical protein